MLRIYLVRAYNHVYPTEQLTIVRNNMKKKTIKSLILILTLLLLVIPISALAGCKKEEPASEPIEEPVAESEPEQQPKPEPEPEPEPEQNVNPLTGLEIDENTIGKRTVAIMVENHPEARPQWGMTDENYAPDIILEAEVEGGITRTMWLFGDFNHLPEMVGPVRSARPPYVKFSELFDAIYIHWGQSGTTSDYVGADTVITQDGVNNINQLSYYGSIALFDRCYDRDVSLEHTGVLYGDRLPTAIEEYGYRTEIEEEKMTRLEFNNEPVPLGETKCTSLTCLISGRSWYKNWTYSEEDKLYHTSDFDNDLTRENILILFDTTEYIYKASKGVSYCNYLLAGGEGKLASQGTIIDIVWSVEDGKLVLKDANGEIVKLNPGKTWIGYASGNQGGYVSFE